MPSAGKSAPDYAFALAAERDPIDIYSHIYTGFGETQADSYLQSLQGFLTMLAEPPRLGIDVSFVRTEYRRFIRQRHAVYYKAIRTGILVVRVLGPGMLSEPTLP